MTDPTDRRLLVHDGTFAALDAAGDIHGHRGTSPDGLFQHDTRHLSRWLLTADGAPLTRLTADGDTAVLTPPGTRDEPPRYTLWRRQEVSDGVLRERLLVRSNSAADIRVALTLEADADFADQFELRGDDRHYDTPGAVHAVTCSAEGAVLTRTRDTWRVGTHITGAPPADTVDQAPGSTRLHLRWELKLQPGEQTTITLTARPEHPAARPLPPAGPLHVAHRPATSWPELEHACRQGLADLESLRVPAAGADGEALRPPGAGIPWFLTLFGRDSLLTSLFALPYAPELAAATLPALAAVQGTAHEETRVEQPGKIAHEIRHGELAHFGQIPYGRYYGSVDSTPLFLVLLAAYTDVAGDALARALEPHARAAVGWLLTDGGLRDHGYLVYRSGDAHGGLVNQNWKDSAGAICFRDGTPATGDIAVAEAQGYAYDALVRTARLSRTVWDDPAFADLLEAEAAELRDRFTRHFWMADEEFPALALDGEGRQVDALASDAGHLLWSGILPPALAATTGRRLMRSDFFSGWGIRTLASGQRPYHPLSYHRGSIWPHDNAIVALGLAKAGLTAEAHTLARGLVDAAALHDWRLPEVMAGYGRDEHPTPVPYPHSCSPQAWAAATPLALLSAVGQGPTAAGEAAA
ncbi:glycogen debranching N-terminal domain-containing protein [Streptomyces sp. NPDC008150]|uniref:amylo-alpha-1,6-glucosidase n=1 Tax=Streptomyces sp. NPDC008150 TaxID=3364816 RepID=UPI0036E0B70C